MRLQSSEKISLDDELVKIIVKPDSFSETREWQFAIRAKDWEKYPVKLLNVHKSRKIAEFSMDSDMEEIVEVKILSIV